VRLDSLKRKFFPRTPNRVSVRVGDDPLGKIHIRIPGLHRPTSQSPCDSSRVSGEPEGREHYGLPSPSLSSIDRESVAG
jgi:hypothetical protein